MQDGEDPYEDSVKKRRYAPRPDRSAFPDESSRPSPRENLSSFRNGLFARHPSALKQGTSKVPSNNISGMKAPAEMRNWAHYFDEVRDVKVGEDTFRCYIAGRREEAEEGEEEQTIIVFLHGCGHSALSWALVASNLSSRCTVLAYDARGHGMSRSKNEINLSAEQQAQDAVHVIEAFFKDKKLIPRIVLCGQSMGGAIATRVVTSNALSNVVGLIVVDVVEGTALSALPYMRQWIRDRKKSFSSIEDAVQYVVKAGHVRNYESATVSVPSQLSWSKEREKFVWRTPLHKSEEYWEGWFKGMSRLFLGASAAKLLILAAVDRLDRELTLAHMQGKFQNVLITSSGHAVHEDQPIETANAIEKFLERNLFVDGGDIPKAVMQKIKASQLQ